MGRSHGGRVAGIRTRFMVPMTDDIRRSTSLAVRKTVSTGITGLDDILAGGLTRERGFQMPW